MKRHWRIYARTLADYLGLVFATEQELRAALGPWLMIEGNRVVVRRWQGR